MSRRIALVTVGLVVALLLLAVVPLGFSLTSNERSDFEYGVMSEADQLAARAEEYLADHDPRTAMDDALGKAATRGDCAAVYAKDLHVVAVTQCTKAADKTGAELAAQIQAGADQASARDGEWLLVAVPVGDDGNAAGVAILARNADPMNDRITAVWAWLAATDLAVLAAGVLFALWLGRWVARPLTVLGASAAHFGDGALETRAPTTTGPNEVRELSAAFNRMAERIQSLVGSHREWVADVSHQLRTPLTALRLRVDVLAEDADAESAEELAGLQLELARLGSLVDGLLTVARAETSVPRPETVRADEIATDRVAAWDPVARERGVKLEAHCPYPARAWLGPGDLEQMLDNLIANALDAVPEGGGIEITATATDEHIEMRVVDNGPGMSAQARANAFRRFGQSSTGGNGLGLAIVHRIAAANAAEVTLHETPAGGLTAILRLPTSRTERQTAAS
ncbi:MAG TPA: HAMP domain-containing sensor histidine kinase [Actinospica sp.]|nr:HAMP domain-containing sensor histidine kinase [Actinospica sp.]